MQGWLAFIGNLKMTDSQILSRRPKTPTQQRGERRVTDLLRAAEHLFATAGYDATPMSGIAQLAGASIGSLYQFFPSKESLGNALLLEYMKELSGKIAALKATSPVAQRMLGQKLVEIVFNYTLEHPACRVLTETPSVPKTDSFGVFSASVQDLLSAIAPSMKAAELLSIAQATWLMVRATVQGIQMFDARKGAALRREMQQAIGSYLEERLDTAAATRSEGNKRSRRAKPSKPARPGGGALSARACA
jgi:AcrR family transcriptional regulator